MNTDQNKKIVDKKDAYQVFEVNDDSITSKIEKVKQGKKFLKIYSDSEHDAWVKKLYEMSEKEQVEEINKTLALIRYECNKTQMPRNMTMQGCNEAIQSILGLENATSFWSADIYGESVFASKDRTGRDVFVNHLGKLRCALSESEGKQRVDTETYGIDFETYLDIIGVVKVKNGDTIESSTVVFADNIDKMDMVTKRQKDDIINGDLSDRKLQQALEDSRYIGKRGGKVDSELDKSAKIAFILENAKYQEGETVDKVSGLVARPKTIMTVVDMLEKAQRSLVAKVFGIKEINEETKANEEYSGEEPQ